MEALLFPVFAIGKNTYLSPHYFTTVYVAYSSGGVVHKLVVETRSHRIIYRGVDKDSMLKKGKSSVRQYSGK